MSDIDYAKRQEEVRQWLQEKGKEDPKTWTYHQADDGRYYYFESDKRKRYGDLGCCGYCNKVYLKDRPFCSVYCSRYIRIHKMEITCSFCGEKSERIIGYLKKSKHGVYFCDNDCRFKAMEASSKNEKFRGLFYKYRGNKLKTTNHVIKDKCTDCNITNENLLHVHHIDSNRENNSKENLEILCPNHHAIRHLNSSLDKKKFDTLTERKYLNDINIYRQVASIKEKSILKNSINNTNKKGRKNYFLEDERGAYVVHSGKKRYGQKIICLKCNEPFLKLKRNEGHFCSRYCADKFFNVIKDVKCSHCGSLFERRLSKIKSELIFCDKICQAEASKKGGILKKSHYNDEASYREKAFRNLPNKCADCDVCFEPILDVHHKDGNHDNNQIDNLEIVCPTHHVVRHTSENEDGVWVYTGRYLTPRDKLDEVRKFFGI